MSVTNPLPTIDPFDQVAMHACAPEGYRCSDCTIDARPCLDCLAAYYQDTDATAVLDFLLQAIEVPKDEMIRSLHALDNLNRHLILARCKPPYKDNGVRDHREEIFSHAYRDAWKMPWQEKHK